ncbi:MAG: hypothetical protein AB7L28_20795 [Kofleriaceae bacterium]
MAKARSGTSKSKASSKKNPTAPKDASRASAQAREIEGGDSVMVVQFSEPDPLPPGDIETFVTDIVGRALATTTTRPRGDKAWTFFLATDRVHPAQHHCWLGVGASVPVKIVDAVQAELVAHGSRVTREHAVIAHHALRPLLVLTAHSVEVPIGATSPDDATLGQLADRIVRKPFVVGLKDLFKKDLLAAMLLGDARPFHLSYFAGDSLATLAFARVDLQMFLRHGDGSYTAMTKFSSTPPCVIGFDFLEPQLAELLSLLPEQTGEGLINALIQGRPFRVQAGSVVVGALARPAPPDGSEATTYVVERFTALRDADLAAHF